jgi:hypothetical protein
MINYNNGKIYKIESMNGDEGDIYIGSTTKKLLSQRMSGHKYLYKKWKLKETHKFMCFDIFDKYGVDNCIITLLETVHANSKDELIARESYYIRNFNCLNRTIPDRTRKEYKEDHKDLIKAYKKLYDEDHKNDIKLKDTCECGSIYSHNKKSRHNKTKKHINYLNSLIL